MSIMSTYNEAAAREQFAHLEDNPMAWVRHLGDQLTDVHQKRDFLRYARSNVRDTAHLPEIWPEISDEIFHEWFMYFNGLYDSSDSENSDSDHDSGSVAEYESDAETSRIPKLPRHERDKLAVDAASVRKRFAHLEHDPWAWVQHLASLLQGRPKIRFFKEAKAILQEEDGTSADPLGDIFRVWFPHFANIDVGIEFRKFSVQEWEQEPHARLRKQRKVAREKEKGTMCHTLSEAFEQLGIDQLCHSSRIEVDVHYEERDYESTIELYNNGVLALGNWEACKKPYVAIKIGVPEHILVAVYNRKTHRLEVFDSGPTRWTHYAAKSVAQLVTLLDNLSELPKIRIVNKRHLQKMEEVGYCQTWILWYMYKRFGHGQKWTANEIADVLNNASFEELGDEIREFYNLLVDHGP